MAVNCKNRLVGFYEYEQVLLYFIPNHMYACKSALSPDMIDRFSGCVLSLSSSVPGCSCSLGSVGPIAWSIIPSSFIVSI